MWNKYSLAFPCNASYKNNMNILSLIWPSPLEPMRNDAMMVRIFSIKKLMEILGHNVDLTCYIPQCFYKKIIDQQILDDIGFNITSLPNLQYLKDIKKNDYDMVYANTSWASFNSLLGKCRKNPPIISDIHGLLSEEYMVGRDIKTFFEILSLSMRKIVDYSSLNFSNKLICVSNKMIRYLNTEKKIPLNKMNYVTNGIDLNFFKSASKERIDDLRDQLGIENKTVFGYLGNFQKWQGIDNFINAATKTNDKYVSFLFVGAPKLYKNKNICCIPKIPRSAITNYYSICDILVLPRPSCIATEVAAPTKFAEYTSMGKPILATNVGDAAELIKKYKCGIIARSNKVSDLSDSINMFKALSEKDLKGMGINSRVLAEKEFDWNKQANNLKLCLDSI